MKAFNSTDYVIHFQTKKIKLSEDNLFVEGLEKGKEVSFWEKRFKSLEEDYLIASRTFGEVTLYSFFCNHRKKESKFK